MDNEMMTEQEAVELARIDAEIKALRNERNRIQSRIRMRRKRAVDEVAVSSQPPDKALGVVLAG